MKKYLKELVALLSQLLVFYIIPSFAGPTDTMGLISLIIILTLIISLLYGLSTNEKIKYVFPIVVAVMFIPTIFIYYNESALIHTMWYLVISTVGVIVGTVAGKALRSLKK